MNNSKKIILDLCGGTGSWSKPYAKAGYKVINITLPEYDVTKCAVSGEFLIFPRATGETHIIRASAVYGV